MGTRPQIRYTSTPNYRKPNPAGVYYLNIELILAYKPWIKTQQWMLCKALPKPNLKI